MKNMRLIDVDVLYEYLDKENLSYERDALKIAIKELKKETISKDFIVEKIVDEIIDNSFCSDIFNDKTDIEIIKLDTVLDIIKKNLGGINK